MYASKQRQERPHALPSSHEPAPYPLSNRDTALRFPQGLKWCAILFLLIGIFVAGCNAGGTTTTNEVSTPTAGSTANAQPGTTDSETTREAVIAKVQPAVVQINIQGGGLGSGVIIDRRGYIITNNHVVEGAKGVEVVLYGGEALSAQIVGTSPPDDLAVVKITPPARMNLTVAPLGDSSQLRVGQAVLAIGNPLGITQTVTSGIVSALNRIVGTIPDAVQTDAAINPGNSGGALVDLQGDLVGVPTATAIDPQFKTPANGVGFAVPSNRVQFIAPQLIQSGRVINSGRATLGINGTSVDQSLETQYQLPVNQGVLIASVTSGGPAARAGLRAGDVVVQLDGKPISSISVLDTTLLRMKPGDIVTVGFYRGSQQQTARLTLGELKIG